MASILLTRCLIAVVCSSSFVVASFSPFDNLNKNIVAAAFDVSASCLTALNSTLNCDPSTSSLAALGPDDIPWSMTNVTSLCTSDCRSSLTSWVSKVKSACGTETYAIQNDLYQAVSAPYLWKYGYDLVCTQDSAKNWCFYNSQSWKGSDYQYWSGDVCLNPVASQRPSECSDPNFTLGQLSDNMTSIRSLYNNTLYCSDCFLKLWQQRLLHPFLSPSAHTSYLLREYSALQKTCSRGNNVTTSSLTLYHGLASSTTTHSTSKTSSSSTSASPSCQGQLVSPLPQPRSCNNITDSFHVSTGDAKYYTSSAICFIGAKVCLPQPCELDTIWDSTSCDTLATRYKTTLAQFLSWNPNLLGNCAGVTNGQRVCKSPPGGLYVPSGVISAPTAAGSYYTTATAAEPTQSGTIKSCGRYYNVVVGDTCNSVALRFGINTTELYSLNTYLNSACTNLWQKYAVCVAPVTPPPVTKDGTCGPQHNNAVCQGSSYGSCCSIQGRCGSTEDYCASGNCVSGACSAKSGPVSSNGLCGPSYNGTVCEGSKFGSCCSIYGHCGNTGDYCGPGNCYSGECDPDTGGPSINGECGPLFAGNKTCTGTQFGSCCSNNGYCGSTSDYCSKANCYSGACSKT